MEYSSSVFCVQLNAQEREIQRLTGMLEGGRPLAAIRKDCSCICKDKLHKLNSLAKEVEVLGLQNKELEQKLKGGKEFKI
jgi:hypothetical protein